MWSPDYIDEQELTDFVRIPDLDDDPQIRLKISASSRAVDRCTRRQFGLVAAPEARYYTAFRDAQNARWLVLIDDLMTNVGLAVAFDAAGDGTYSTTVAAYLLRPVNAAQKGRPWTLLAVPDRSGTLLSCLDGGVRVTARWGWTAVPSAVKEAVLLQTSRLLLRRDLPFGAGVAGSPAVGSVVVRLLPELDPDVEVTLRDYRRDDPVIA